MGLLEQLQEQGWYLLPAGMERLLEGTPGSTLDAKQAIKLALDIDLREIGGGALSSISARGTKADSIDGNIVVQVLKVRNISAPKANEESKAAPRLLKLTITDGQTQYSALEGEHVPSLSLETAPGTKIYLKNGPIKILQGMLILNANNVSILGGKVPALFEKWELGRAMAKYAKGGRMQLSASGPPPWIPFGQKIQQNLPSDTKNFKSLQTKEKDESKENAEFTALRNDAIAEANKLGTKKTFGGGAKQMVDANVQKIMDKGFSEEQANHALKLTRNNVHRALSNLQRIEERKQRDQPFGGVVGGDFKTGKVEPPQKLGKPTMRGKRESESDASSKPSAKVSLFDFLEDILPETDTSANKKSSSKESTPFGGKDGKPGADRYEGKSSGGYNSYSSSNPNNRSSAPNPYQSNSSSSYNSNSTAGKSYNQQRFENNISSSFANRNTHPGPSNRSYGQQNSQQQQQQNSNPSSGYKQQSSYNDYNNSRGYRGGPPNATSGGGYHTSEGHPRGGRPESKYNQSHSSYNNPHQQNQQQQQQYRNDSYNNNSSSGNNAGVQGNSKYAPNSGSGKSQPANNSGYGGYGGHAESRGAQSYNGQADGVGGGRKHPGYQQQQQQQHQTQQQQPQQSSYQGSKPVQGYNAAGGGGAGNHTGGHQNNTTNNNHYGQQHNVGGASNNYNSNSTQGVKPTKGSRYTKDDSQKFSGPPPKSTTTTTTVPPPQARNPSGPQQKVNSQPQHGANTASGLQPPFVPGNKQPSPGPPGSSVSNSNIINNNNAAAKMAQLTEATAGMQIGNSKPFSNNNTQIKPHQQQQPPPGPMVSGPPPHPPQPATTPVVPKNFIQLPNGFNYNPYQIMGFQNKQTNEFALNVLKSQQFDALQTAHLAGGPPGGPPVQAIPGVTIPGTATVVSSVLAPAGALPNWKIGDRCLAKYWEDGGFYNAEITAISENTFVVCFLEYGNYEEVLKTDCIPLTGGPAGPPHPPATMGFHHPQAALGVPQPHPAMMAPHPPPVPPTGAYPVQQGAADSQSVAQQHFNPGYKPQPSQYPPHPHPHGHPPPQSHHHQQQQRPSKFREQRPMYVPPAQRK